MHAQGISDSDHRVNLGDILHHACTLQVQGLLDILPASRPNLLNSLGPSSNPLNREQQEEHLIEKLRQIAGPAAIAQAETALIKEAYSIKNPGGLRQMCMADQPRIQPLNQRPMPFHHFVEQFIDVIRRDLQVLGYDVAFDPITNYDQRSEYCLSLSARCDGAAEVVLSSMITAINGRPALRVREY